MDWISYLFHLDLGNHAACSYSSCYTTGVVMVRPAILVTLFKRPEFTRRILSALSQCYGVEAVPIFISIDKSAESKVNQKVDEVFAVAHEWWKEQCKTRTGITLISQPKPLGIDVTKLEMFKQIWGGKFDAIILLEDDMVASKDFVRYHMAMLERYQSDPHVLSVSAYNKTGPEYLDDDQVHHRYSVDRSQHFDCWGASFWKDRWIMVMGDNNQRYLDFCTIEGKDSSNGLFDHHWERVRNREFMETIRPRIARCQNLVGKAGTDTAGQNANDPSAESGYNPFYWTLDVNPESDWWHE